MNRAVRPAGPSAGPLAASLAVVVVTLGLGTACGPPQVTFDVPVTAETTVEGAGLIDDVLGAFGFEDFGAIDLEETQEFQNQDVRREQVTSARLTTLNLTIVSPQGANFDWLNSLSFSVGADGLDKIELASKDIDDGQSAVALELVDVDISAYVRGERMAITTAANARKPPDDTTVQVDLNFKISAEAF